MREYQVQYTRDGMDGMMHMFAHSRDDAIRFVTDLRRCKVTSARLTSRKYDNKPTQLPTADAGVDYMLRDAEEQVKANAHSGRAIGRYLRLKLAMALSEAEVVRACEWIVRQVEQRDGKI